MHLRILFHGDRRGPSLKLLQLPAVATSFVRAINQLVALPRPSVIRGMA